MLMSYNYMVISWELLFWMLFPANLLFFKDVTFILGFHPPPYFFITGDAAIGLNISKIFLYNLQPSWIKSC